VLTRLPGAEVVVASRDGGQVTAQNGLTFSGLNRLADVECCDLICVPGGPGTSPTMLDQAFMAQLRRLADGARYVTSVCTGSLILGAAGLLHGRRATCHWSSLHLLARFGATPVAERVVQDGRLITGGGVTAGIDFGLAVVAELAGEAAARKIALGLEYAPAPPVSGDPASADAATREAYLRLAANWLDEREAAVAQAVRRLRATAPRQSL
jgi:cyclohexyl-isocyanide hydratase